MVKELIHKGKKYFQCEACEMYYRTPELAKECEEFCNNKNACSTTITKNAVNLE